MKKIVTISAFAILAVVLPSGALDLGDLMNPDDVMLRKPSHPRTIRKTPAPAPKSVTVTQPAPAPKPAMVTQPVPAPKPATVTQPAPAPVIKPVAQAPKPAPAPKAVPPVPSVVTKTNVVTLTDIVVKTNVVTQTDYVVKTNVVVEKRMDDSEKQVLEAQRNQAVRDAVVERSARESAEAARGAAERKVVAAQVARAEAEAEMARMKEELAKAEEARKLAEAKLKAAETKAAVAEKKAAAAETAREEVASQVDAVAKQALDERKARERAEAEMRAAERRAETERNAAIEVARKLDAVTNVPPPTVETPDYAPDRPAAVVEKKAAKDKTQEKDAGKAKELTGRDAIITADRMDFDRKEGVILFDRNVYVDDEQYQMHADRLFVFLETNSVENAGSSAKKKGHGGNDSDAKQGKDIAEKSAKKKKSTGGVAGVTGGNTSLKRLVAIGHVSITNDTRSAYCARATYSKKSGKIVMYGNDDITPWILDPQQSKTPQYGEKITFWTISEQVEVEKPVLSGSALGKGKGGNPLDALKR